MRRPRKPVASTGTSTRPRWTWMGVDKIKLEWMPWESQVPALLSKRTDVIAGNIHHTPARDKVISFSGPAYWYGPVIIVAKGNPLGIKSYDDLKGKKVGSISGSAADSYLGQIGVKSTPFKTEIDELQSLNQGRLEAVLEDDLVYLEFAKSNAGSNLEPLWASRPRPRSSTVVATAWHVSHSARRTARCARPIRRRWRRCGPTGRSATS